MKKAIEMLQKIQIAIGGFFLCVFLYCCIPDDVPLSWNCSNMD